MPFRPPKSLESGECPFCDPLLDDKGHNEREPSQNDYKTAEEQSSYQAREIEHGDCFHSLFWETIVAMELGSCWHVCSNFEVMITAYLRILWRSPTQTPEVLIMNFCLDTGPKSKLSLSRIYKLWRPCSHFILEEITPVENQSSSVRIHLPCPDWSGNPSPGGWIWRISGICGGWPRQQTNEP